jgi:hypothetical protein
MIGDQALVLGLADAFIVAVSDEVSGPPPLRRSPGRRVEPDGMEFRHG